MNIQMIREAAEYITGKAKYKPEIAVILGSGLGAMAEKVENQTIIKNESIPHFPASTVVGHAGQFIFGDYMGKKVIAGH